MKSNHHDTRGFCFWILALLTDGVLCQYLVPGANCGIKIPLTSKKAIGPQDDIEKLGCTIVEDKASFKEFYMNRKPGAFSTFKLELLSALKIWKDCPLPYLFKTNICFPTVAILTPSTSLNKTFFFALILTADLISYSLSGVLLFLLHFSLAMSCQYHNLQQLQLGWIVCEDNIVHCFSYFCPSCEILSLDWVLRNLWGGDKEQEYCMYCWRNRGWKLPVLWAEHQFPDSGLHQEEMSRYFTKDISFFYTKYTPAL